MDPLIEEFLKQNESKIQTLLQETNASLLKTSTDIDKDRITMITIYINVDRGKNNIMFMNSEQSSNLLGSESWLHICENIDYGEVVTYIIDEKNKKDYIF